MKKKIYSSVITVKNAEGDADTTAEIVVRNQINYTPKVSVIIPVYNVEQYLRQCLDSVVNQTLREIEIICVDDGSTDSSLEILKEYAALDNRITVIKQQNLYAGVARNTGLSVAKGEYLSFLDSDDFFEPEMLETMYRKAIEDQSDVVVCGYTVYDSINDTKTIKTGGSRNLVLGCHSNIYMENLFQLTNPMPWNKMFSASFVHEHNLFFQNTPVANDLYFVYLSMALAAKVSLLSKPFIIYRIFKKDSLSSKRNKYPFAFIDAFKNLKQQLEKRTNFDVCSKSFYKEFFGSIGWTEKLVRNKANFQKKVTDKLQKDFHIDNPFALPPIYISLTSYPQRISSIHHTIQSLLEQSYKADKVILWLAEEQFPNKEADLPQSLLDLVTKGLEIEWCHDIKSYKKLIPALQKYPDAIIVTADDDIIYPQTWLELLVNAHIMHPQCICCHRAFFITQNNGNIAPYKNWYRGKFMRPLGMYGIKAEKHFVSRRIFYTSGSGALYPPYSLHKDVINEKLFKKLAPTEDDIWYWAMALRNNTSLCLVEDNLGIFQVNKYASQENSLYRINSQNDTTNKIFVKMFEQYPELKERVLSDTPLIISLTSYPARIKTVHQTIYSLLTQTVRADKIILWLAEEQFPNKESDLPQQLLDLTKIGLEIGWYHDIKSFKKLIPTLQKYPESVIVTADDDVIYAQNWLEKLLVSYVETPDAVHCHRAHGITFKNNILTPYSDWIWYIKNNIPNYNHLFTGVGGVLYPPHCLHQDVLNEEKFMRLCPKADDIWFWAMALKNNTPIKVVKNNIIKQNVVDGTQEQALWRNNVQGGQNDLQLQNVLTEYPELLNKLDKSDKLKTLENPNKSDKLNKTISQTTKPTPAKIITFYKIFNFIPLYTYKKRGGNQVWKIFGIPIWRVRKIADTNTIKYYLFGTPLLSDSKI